MREQQQRRELSGAGNWTVVRIFVGERDLETLVRDLLRAHSS